MGTGYFPPILYLPYPPFPSMSYRIKLLHDGASHTVPPWGAVLMSLTDWLTTPRALGPAGSAPRANHLSAKRQFWPERPPTVVCITDRDHN